MRFSLIKQTLLASCLLFALSGCGNSFDYGSIAGIYDLYSACLDQSDVTEDYSLYQLTLFENQTMEVFISQLGYITSRDSTYEVIDTTLTETYATETFIYQYDATAKTLVYTADDYGQTLTVTLQKRVEQPEAEPVDFESVLFGEDIDTTKKFNYAPSVIRTTENGKDTLHVWYCTNKKSAVIMDHIAYRKGTKTDDGKWLFSDENIALAPTENRWDSRHTCDPSVIQGVFAWNDEVYTYLMAYLGCETDDYDNNETGLAVAQAPEGPWIKLDHLNPIVPWARDNPSGTWGTGMPSLLSVDRQGTVLLYYMDSALGVGVEKWDFSDLAAPSCLYRSRLVHNGLKTPYGTLTHISYVEMAYDEQNGRLYVLSGAGIKDPPDGTRTLVNSHMMLAYIDQLPTMAAVDGAMQSMNYTWTVAAYAGPDETTFPRNHNSALVTDPYGRIIDANEIWAVTSTGQITYPFDNIYTYRLRGYIFHL